MSLSSEAKKHLHESLQQQCLNQKSIEYNEAKKLFTGLTDLDYKAGHKEHTFYKYWLTSNGHVSSSDKNETALLEAYQPEEIHSQYIIQMAGKDLKGFVEKVIESVGEPYSKFINIGLYKSHFNLRLLGSAKEG
ncbi:158_t:CDS:2, partial [Racocetra persica]